MNDQSLIFNIHKARIRTTKPTGTTTICLVPIASAHKIPAIESFQFEIGDLRRAVNDTSNPPTFGATVVATVLTTPALRAQWEEELGGMRERIKAMRHALVTKLQAAGVPGDLSYITTQMGMFSYSGLAKEQMQRLRSEFGVYGVDSGRICVAALNSRNIEAVASALAKVM